MPTSPPESDSPLAHLVRTTLSYDTNVMLAAIISLLLVILFVLLLHLYTRWFLLQARRRSRTSVTVPRVLGSRLHQRFTIIDDHSSGKSGLPFSIIASIPLFVSSIEDRDCELECAICLSLFEEEEIGRKLPACGHAFHVECIDMWLHSHSTCPICRAAIHSRKIEIEITDPETDSSGSTIEDELRSEIDAAESSSSIGESRSPNKLLTSSSSCSSSSRSGGKVDPSSNGDESEA
ncbi:hypothetical protein L1987_13325 [Smallanthus sonchifolius]|uniref:Uncharacterized protein n=1 Tax=Smallanthus sonchifolius TaxID=185202 RepID=A0ACB9JH52_9ASTR|nr:hypothetical protein L1987_13325 [Smallanthus sonchifolius]